MANLLYNYTDVEQSKRLMEAGLDPNTADMCCATETGRNTGGQYWAPKLGLPPSIRHNLFSFRNGYELPCWSFAALFALLPVIDYDAASISYTKLVDVFEYSKGNEAEE